MIRYKLRELIKAKELKEGRHITLEEIGQHTGVHRTTLSKIVNGRTVSSTTDTLAKLCEYFEVGIGDVVEYYDH